MRVSQRLDYALRAIVLLAAQPPGDYVAAGDLADRLLMPRRFVEQQISVLTRAGIVESRRGSNGGAALSRPASEISVFGLNWSLILYPKLAMEDVVRVVAAVIITSVIASVWPAMRAARLQPAAALKA